jgi:hypothetical protein
MVLVHDDDLAPLHGIYDNAVRQVPSDTCIYVFFLLKILQPLDCLQSDVVLSHIRSIKPTVHCAQIGAHSQHRSIFNTHRGGTYPKDLSSAPESGTDIESTWVATLSNIFEKRNASSSRNVPGYGIGTEGYTYPCAPSQQPQVQVGHPRPPPPPPARNIPAQPATPNLNQVPRSLVTYQTGTGHDNRPLFPEAFPRAPDPTYYGSASFATPGRPGSHQPPVQECIRSPQVHVSLPQVYVCQAA